MIYHTKKCIYYLKDFWQATHFHALKQQNVPMTLAFWPKKRGSKREKKRCVQDCWNWVISHATNCQNVAGPLNLTGDGLADFSQMLGVVTPTPAWCASSGSHVVCLSNQLPQPAQTYLLSKQDSLNSKNLWISHSREETRSSMKNTNKGPLY